MGVAWLSPMPFCRYVICSTSPALSALRAHSPADLGEG